MRSSLLSDLEECLKRREDSGGLRVLPSALADKNVIDFCSNDYLGFARSPVVHKKVRDERERLLRAPETQSLGATGSRVLTGNSAYAEEVEHYLAEYYGSEAALLFGSGYLLNLSLVAYVPQKGDILFYDSLDHNSLREGMKITRAKCIEFIHNDLEDLEQKFKEHISTSSGNPRNIIVAVESLYSMDGDYAPLEDLTNLCERYGANLIVDEAHTTGSYPGGRGLTYALRLQDRILCTVYTFGKAMGYHGAVVCCSNTLKQYLINYARPFIYTTALPLDMIGTIKMLHIACQEQEAIDAREHLTAMTRFFRSIVKEECKNLLQGSVRLLDSDSPIQGLVVPGNHRVIAVASMLQKEGFLVKAIRSPTVPKGEERLRIIIHAHNTKEDIQDFGIALRRTLAACPSEDTAAAL